MQHSFYVVIFLGSLLFAACEKKDESSATSSKMTSTTTDQSTSSGKSTTLIDTRAAKWNLKVYDSNEATLSSSHITPERELLRVDIKKAGTQMSWHIQLNQAPLAVQAGHRYRVTFQARADNPRNGFIGIARDHDPWTDLGLYTAVSLGPEWHTFQEEFVASANDENARVVIDLGGSASLVEFEDVRLYRVGDA